MILYVNRIEETSTINITTYLEKNIRLRVGISILNKTQQQYQQLQQARTVLDLDENLLNLDLISILKIK